PTIIRTAIWLTINTTLATANTSTNHMIVLKMLASPRNSCRAKWIKNIGAANPNPHKTTSRPQKSTTTPVIAVSSTLKSKTMETATDKDATTPAHTHAAIGATRAMRSGVTATISL